MRDLINPVFKGMIVSNPITCDLSVVTEITSLGAVKLDESNLIFGVSNIKPAFITAVRLGCYKFGIFRNDEKRVLYHEPDMTDKNHDFYGEYNIRENYLSLSYQGNNVSLENIKYIHEVQLALILIGKKDLAIKTKINRLGVANIL
jgi:hypothetical protein